jgi:protein involved in polysaccharide export with SLBB domain
VTFSRRLRSLLPPCLFAALVAFQGAAEPYRVEPGDTVALSIFAQPELSGPHRVREDGSIALHLIGEVPVAGMTLTEIASAVAAAAARAFQADASVIADMAAYRDVYVLGEVARPGALPFTPGLTVLKALALAGDARRTPVADGEEGRRVVDERRRHLLARMDIEEAEARIAAIDAEIARLDADGLAETTAGPPPLPTAPDDRLGQEEALIAARRDVTRQAVDGASRQQELADEEAGLLAQRSVLVARQLEITEENLRDIDALVERGLARRERQLDLAVDADDFRSDALEIAAFEARARQIAANAENSAAVAVSRYREALIADRIAALRSLEAATIQLATSREFLMAVGGAASIVPDLGTLQLRYEIVRGGESLPADEGALLRPADVLRVTVASASEG